MKEVTEQATHLLQRAPWETWLITSILALVLVLIVYGDVIARCWKIFWDTVLSTTEDHSTDLNERKS